jgi:hypothetical protein
VKTGASDWSRREFVQLIFAVGLGSIGTHWSLIKPDPRRCRIALFGSNLYGRKILQSILDVPNMELVGLWDKDEGSLADAAVYVKRLTKCAPQTYLDRNDLLKQQGIDLIVVAAQERDFYEKVMAMSGQSHLMVVQPVCQALDAPGRLECSRIRRGRLVRFGAGKHLVPELVALSDFIEEGRSVSNGSSYAPNERFAGTSRGCLYSEWAIWIAPPV